MRYLSLTAVLLSTNVSFVFAQYDQLPQVGLKQFAQYQHSDVDSVDLSSGNVNLHIPLVAFPQLGDKLRLNFIVRYNEPQWAVLLSRVNLDGNGNPVASGFWQSNISGGRPIGVDVVRDQGITAVQSTTTRLAPPACNYCDPDPVPFYSTMFGIRDRSGAEHDYGMQAQLQNAPNNGTTVTRAPDGSGWVPDEESMAPGTYNLPSTSFHDRDGLHYVSFHPSGAPGTLLAWNVSDAHGNTISTAADGWNDSMGRHIPGSWTGQGAGFNNAPNGNPPLEDDPFPGVPGTDISACGSDQTYIATRVWTVPSSTDSGGSQTYTFCYAKHIGTTNFTTTKLGPFRGGADQASFSVILLSKILLPNNTAYTFQYDPQFLDLTQLTLPTGGVVTYQYAQIPWEQCSTSMPVKRVVIQRTETTNAYQAMVWKYRWPQTGICDPEPGFSVPVVVTNPDGNDVWHYEQTNASNQIVNGTIFYQGTTGGSPNSPTGTMLKKVETNAPLNNSILFGSLPEIEAPDSSGAVTLLPGDTYQMQFPGPVIKTVTTLYDPVGQTVQSSQESDATQIPPSGNVEYINPINYYYPQSGTCACLIYSGTTLIQDHDIVQGAGNGPGTLLRQTVMDYRFLDNGGQNYASAGLTDLPSSVTIQDGNGTQLAKTTYSYDESSYSSGAVAGELTTTQRLLGASTWLATHTKFNSSGVFAGSIDAKNFETRVNSYDCSNSAPSSITIGYGTSVAESSSYVHDCNTGAITSHTDPNNKITTYNYNDPLSRITAVNYPDGGSTQLTYTDGSNSSLNLSTATGGPQGSMSTTVSYDLLGRTIDVQTSAPSGTIHQTTDYDSMGRVWHSSNPFISTSDATYGLATNSFDELGRPKLLSHADRTSVSYTYNGPFVTTTDESGKAKTSTNDGLGRLTAVVEPGGIATNYQYDALGNLKQVTQNGVSGETARTRSFNYDSLSRLTTSTNPESGTICYGQWSNGSCVNGYDANGNLLNKTDANGTLVSYSYDALNRLTDKSFQDGTPNQHFRYDQASVWMGPQTNTIGRLSQAYTDPDMRHPYSSAVPCNSQNSATANYHTGYGNPTYCNWTDTLFFYDAMGRLSREGIATPSEAGWNAHEVDATYDLAGNVTDMTYPDGSKIMQSFDSAGRLSALRAGTAAQPITAFISNISYFPDGSPQTITYGNGVSDTLAKNSRLQPCRQTATFGSLNLLDRQYFYNTNDTTSPCGSEASNNGNIWHIIDGLPGATNNQNFNYDSLNRLTSFDAPNMAGAYRSQSFSYDSFGNISASRAYNNAPSNKPNVVGTPNARMFPNPNFNPGAGWPYDTNNRLVDATFDCSGINGTHYDLAGNVQCGGSNTDFSAQQYVWDAESRISRVNAEQGSNTYYQKALYTYDANGNRVRSDQVDTGGNDVSWREYSFFNGRMLAEKDQDGRWSNYIYANGKRIARVDNFDVQIHSHGTQCAPNSCPITWAAWELPFVGYTIKNGDRISWRQYQSGGATGGIGLHFSNDTYSNWDAHDTDGQVMNYLTTQNTWVNRTVDLSAYTGQTVGQSFIDTEGNANEGTWDEYFEDIAVYSTDGTVTPIYHRQDSLGLSEHYNPSPMPDRSVAVERVPATEDAAGLARNTTYYLGDQVGTAQMELSGGGWPVWKGEYAPFGQELDTNSTPNRYKFTGKERDTESGLDYFGARYYGSSMGRFMSPDPVFISAQRLMGPQSLNLYSYVRNNPLALTDDTGLDFYLACQTSDHSGCGQVQNGSSSAWVQGQTVNGSFQATDVDMNKQGDASAGYHDQFGNQYSGTFDQNNGVSFTNTATGATSGQSQFIDGSDRTQLSGSGAFAGITGNFFSDCGGSCQGRAALSGSAAAFSATESQLNKQGGILTFLDRFSGAHQQGAQWKDSNGYVHMLQDPNGRMEMHFEGHPTGVDVQQFVLHMVDTIRDASSGRANAEKKATLPQ